MSRPRDEGSKSRRYALGGALALAAVTVAATLSGSALAAPGDINASLAVDVNPDPSPLASDSNPSDIINVGGTMFFSARDTAHGRELWKSDGTPAGTIRLSDINPGPSDGLQSSHAIVNVGGTVFFTAFDGTNGDLYKEESPYTSAPTRIQINPSGGSGAEELVAFNGAVFFSAFNGTDGVELWKSNGGTVASGGTAMVADINTGPGESSRPEQLTPVGNTLFLVATDGADGTEGKELWKTNGSIGDKTELEINAATDEGSDPQELVNAGGTLFLSAENGSVGRELWKASESSTSATPLEVVSGSGGSDPQNLGPVGSTVFFNADDGVHGFELWKSDGTAPQLVADINPAGDSFPSEPVAYNGKLFFDADDGVHGEELWKSDGGPLAAGHTELSGDINPGPGSSSPSEFAVFDGLLWFRVTNTVPAGSELWKTDGASVRTFDINPGPASSGPNDLVAGPGALFFAANDGIHGIELWKATAEPAAPPPSGGGGAGAGPQPPSAPAKKKKCKKRKKRAAAAKKCKKRK